MPGKRFLVHAGWGSALTRSREAGRSAPSARCRHWAQGLIGPGGIRWTFREGDARAPAAELRLLFHLQEET